MNVRNRAFRARGRLVLGVALVIGLAALRLRAEQTEAPRPRTTFVELDAVVVDGHDRPIRGLQRDDFEIREDGRTVAVTGFTEVSAAGIDGHADARYLVLLLDDTGIGPLATVVVFARS